MKKFILLTLLFCSMHENSNAGIGDIGFSDVTNLTSSAAFDLMEEVAFGLDFHDYEPAAPQGLLLGLDVGADLTSLTLSDDFLAAATLIGANTSEIPSPLPLIRINVHKGLPFGIDLGFGFVSLGDILLMGGSIKWAFVPGPLYLAVRAAYNYTKVNFIRTRTYSLDALISRKLGYFFEPYGGIGFQLGMGELEIPTGQVAEAGFESGGTFTTFNYFAGVRFHLAVIKITGEYTATFAGQMSMGMKVSFGI